MKIFVANTGRCGSKYMAEIFGSLTDYPSFHEPRPLCIAETMASVNSAGELSESAKEEIAEKIKQVARDSKDGNYFESNNVFIKSYFEYILARFSGSVDCIYLERNPLEVLISYGQKCRLQESDWFLDPKWEKNLLHCNYDMSFFEIVLWNWYEIKQRYFVNKHRFHKTFEMKFEDLNSSKKWEELFDHFEIPHKNFKHLPKVATHGIDYSLDDGIKTLIDKWDKTPTKGFFDSEFRKNLDLLEQGKRAIEYFEESMAVK